LLINYLFVTSALRNSMYLSRMLTEIIPIEDLLADGAEYRDGHDKALGIIWSLSAIVSTISSSTLIWMIVRSPQRLTTTQHRILFGMAIGDILFSLSAATFRAMVPSDMDYLVWNAQGNQTTCNVMGFMSGVSVVMSLLYSCSLNIYSLAIVKYNKTDYYIRNKMEPFLHGVPIASALTGGFAMLATQGYNSEFGGGCLAPVYDPPHCIGIEDGQVREGFKIPCGRGRDGPSAIIFHGVFFLLFFGSPLTIGETLWMMYRHVSRQERRMGSYGMGALNHNAPQENNDDLSAASVDGSNGINRRMSSIVTSVKSTVGRLSSRSSANQNNRNSRFVMIRARAYSTAFLLTWLWYIVIIVLQLAGVPRPLVLLYLSNIFSPLQGFWNFMIFMYPKVMKAKRSHGGNLSWWQAITEAFCPAINRWRERRTPRNNENETPQEEEEYPKIPAREQQQGDTEFVTALDDHPGSEEENPEIPSHEQQQGDTEFVTAFDVDSGSEEEKLEIGV